MEQTSALEPSEEEALLETGAGVGRRQGEGCRGALGEGFGARPGVGPGAQGPVVWGLTCVPKPTLAAWCKAEAQSELRRADSEPGENVLEDTAGLAHRFHVQSTGKTHNQAAGGRLGKGRRCLPGRKIPGKVWIWGGPQG